MSKTISLFEIALLVLMTASISYIVSESNLPTNEITSTESTSITKIRKSILDYLGSNLASAAEGLWTCPITNNGTICQEFAPTLCQGNCNQTCFPGPRTSYADCRIGTCIDPTEGTCSPAPRAACLLVGGTWKTQSQSELAECKPGCCLVGNEASYITQKQCTALSTRLGIESNFQNVPNELSCLVLAHPNSQGACVIIDSNEERTCKFTTRQICANSLRGEFHENYLCSNPSLNTTCVKETRTSCVDGKDEIYWFDSCGNQENIFDTDKERSWNSGMVLAKEQSCSLSTSSNILGNQATCGNCNYLEGNVCGTPRAGVDKKPVGSEFVCKDLSCTDAGGTKHKQGESWCAFDSMTGPSCGNGFIDNGEYCDGSNLGGATCKSLWGSASNGTLSCTSTCSFNVAQCAKPKNDTDMFSFELKLRNAAPPIEINLQRSVDVVGSSQYRKVCLNGEIRTEPCQSARRELCVESRNEEAGFSSAACRINQWQQCISANTDPASMSRCAAGEFTDCYVKRVQVGEDFGFDRCVPKYPPGFDLQEIGGGDVGQTVCSLGSQKCTYVKTKRLFGSSYKNSACTTSYFTESMNNLCMSLGDCGLKVNVAGVESNDGYQIVNAQGFTQDYFDYLKVYAAPKPGQKVVPFSQRDIAKFFGLDPTEPNYDSDQKFEDLVGTLGAGAAGGILAAYIAQVGYGTAISSLEAGAGVSYGTTGPGLEVLGVQLGPFGAVAAGALVGGAMGFFIAKLFGLQGDAITATVVAGIIGGAAIAYLGASGSGAALGATSYFAIFSLAFLFWTIVIIVVVALIMVALGIGRSSSTTIEFQCLPWQAPRGGAQCDLCGKNGLPCNKYKCHSLGQACKFIDENEGTSNPACVNANPRDVTTPTITPNYGVLLQNYSYVNVSSNGFRIKGTDVSGCLPALSTVQFGITTDEVSQCKVAPTHTSRYEDMDTFFDGTNLFKLNHTILFPVPSLEAISASTGSQAFTSQQNLNLYVRCSDINGNSNVQEYNINFCISPQDDRTPPIITSFSPESPAFASFTATQQNVTFFTNEPAECRWSSVDQDYTLMPKEATCLNEISDITPIGWPCNVTLPVSSTSSTAYFRCSDQPWKNESMRNRNSQSTSYQVSRSQDQLVIRSITPNNVTLLRAGLPVEVNLTVQTSGGAAGTNRFCEFGWGGQYLQFFDSGTDTHVQPNLILYENRTYTIPIRCRDEVGNEAQRNAVFAVFIDRNGPDITRVYNQNGLHVVTDEPAVCSYSSASCNLALTNGTFLSGNELDHVMDFRRDAPTFITCKDPYGNQGICYTIQGGSY